MKKQHVQVELITLCDYASVSREGKLSINGIFDEMRVQKFPAGLARSFLVATISGTPETLYKLNLKMETKDNDNVNPSLSNLAIEAITGPNGKNNLVIELAGLAFDKEGDYRFKIYDGDDEVGSTLLKVHAVSKPNEDRLYKLPN